MNDEVRYDVHKEPCWRTSSESDGVAGDACARCGQRWPRCVSVAGLRALHANRGQLPETYDGLLMIEIERRGLDFDTLD